MTEYFTGSKIADEKFGAVIARPLTKDDLIEIRDCLVMSYNPSNDPTYVTKKDIMVLETDTEYIFSLRIMHCDPYTRAWVKTDKFSYMEGDDEETMAKYKRPCFRLAKYKQDQALDNMYTRQYSEHLHKKQYELQEIAKKAKEAAEKRAKEGRASS